MRVWNPDELHASGRARILDSTVTAPYHPPQAIADHVVRVCDEAMAA